MSDGYERGVVVDPDGFFVAALRWETGTPAPKLNERATSGGKTPRLIMLRDPYAIENVETDARWDFTPVREDGVLVRSGTWTFPTEERWIVQQRRDIPDLWVFSGQKRIWLERPPRFAEGVKLIDAAPPSINSGKPIWSDAAAGWLAPRNRLIVDLAGTIIDYVTSYVDEDLPEGLAYDPEDIPQGQDELENAVDPFIGDTIEEDGQGGFLVSINCKTNHETFSAMHLRDALQNANERQNFISFLSTEGFSLDEFEQIGDISLNNKLLRKFAAQRGMTIKQAHDSFISTAEQEHKQKKQKKKQMAAE